VIHLDANKAVVLISGGLDSSTTLAIAQAAGYVCYGLTVDYGQRHRSELDAARRVAERLGVRDHKVIRLDLSTIGGSALTDPALAVPTSPTAGIPITYVPARNTVLLGLALGWAEVLEAWDIFIGVNAIDYSGYPDCRPEFIESFESMARLATRAGVEGRLFRIHTPLIYLRKAQIIEEGIRLGLDYSITVSCYQADEKGHACGICEACRLRAEGFRAAGVPDPTCYCSYLE
jgi:7-cyano-7-deazaguanine synthase